MRDLMLYQIGSCLVRAGLGGFIAGLAAGSGLLLHHLWVTPGAICTTVVVPPWAIPLASAMGLSVGITGLGLTMLSSQTRDTAR